VARAVLWSFSMRTRVSLAIAALLVASAACSSSPDAGPPTAQTRSAIGGFPGCNGLYNANPSPTGAYYATDFGCSSDPYFNDPGDTCGSASCIQSGYTEGVCSSGQSNADCQRTVNWYSVGGASYGCGARLEVTNPANGKSVVVMVLDNGPSCTVENDANFWVLDVSYPTIMYLFGEEEGWGDHALVNAVVVDASTPLGPTSGAVSPPPPPPPSGNDAGSPSSDDAGASSPDTGPDSGGETSCSTDGDCNPGSDGSGQICVSGQCVDGCNADWECPGSTSCVDGQCQ
jgi:hypothetical protein